MSELRQDPTTKEWVILAPERAKRPKQAPKKKIKKDEVPAWDASCPFCPGNEIHAPDDTFRIPEASNTPDWEVRVIPNRFPALTPDGDTTRREEGYFFRKMDGFGEHEVIIEGPSHNTPIALMPYQQVEKILIAYQERYNTLKKNPQFKFITIFKNHGWASGTSLVHPHSQLVATPITATYYRHKFDVAVDYYDNAGRCLYCDLMAWDVDNAKARIVADTKEFLIVHPYASRVRWETWILPKRHYASFGLYPAALLAELAKVLKDTLFCLYKGLDDPAFNLMIDTATTHDEEGPYYHWHIRIVPRLTLIAGFEMGSGIYLSSALPEETAGMMRQVGASMPEGECPTFKSSI